MEGVRHVLEDARSWLEGSVAATSIFTTLGFSLGDMLESLRVQSLFMPKQTRQPNLFAAIGLPTLLVTLAIGLVPLLYLLYNAVVRNFSGGRKQRDPGPRRYPLVGNMFETIRNIDRNVDWIMETLQKEDSSWIRLSFPGANAVVVTDPRDLEHVLKTNFANYPKGPEFHGLLGELLGDGIFNADGDSWRMQRKAASHEFSTRSLKELMLTTFNNKVNGALLPLIGAFAEKGVPFDLQEIFQRYTFDTICSMGFGVDPGCIAPDLPAIPFARAFDDAQEAHSRRFMMPQVVYKVKRFLGIGTERLLAEGVKKINEFAYGVIRQRREELAGPSPPEREDLLSRFMAVVDREDAPGTTEHGREGAPSTSDRFLRDIILNFILAGRDTTAVTLTWFFWVLTQRRDVEQKVLDEVEKIAAGKGPGWAGAFDFEDLRSMTYLQAALSETLRLYPAVPSDVKYAVADDVMPSGATVKAGYRVAYHPYSQGRIVKIWGADALGFKPERWIDAEGHYIQHSPYKFPSFQAGPRICLGKDMAYLQMKVVAASLLRRFKFSVVPGHVVFYRTTIVLTMKYGLQMTVERRK